MSLSFLLAEILAFAYSCLWLLLTNIILTFNRLFGSLLPNGWQKQLQHRRPIKDLTLDILPLRQQKKDCVLFFCSSAGEFEQARPLIDEIHKQGDTYIQVVLHSHSGLEYVISRGEWSANFMLTPITDSLWQWGWLFSVLRPSITVVVRHELWPGFLVTAKNFGILALIGGTSTPNRQGFVRTLIKSRLFKKFDRIYTISARDADFFAKTYGVAQQNLLAVGDSKYDRALSRSLASRSQVDLWSRRLQQWGPNLRRMIGGSVHQADVEALLLAYQSLKAPDWQLILVPHHIDLKNLLRIQNECQRMGFSHLLTTKFSPGLGVDQNPPSDLGRPPIIIVDQMGQLAEIYGAGNAAFVGGALHYQVHNVLEPACRGLTLGWGPLYRNSPEAIHLVEHGLATVINDSLTLSAWWTSLSSENLDQNKAIISKTIGNMAGAGTKILTDLRSLVDQRHHTTRGS